VLWGSTIAIRHSRRKKIETQDHPSFLIGYGLNGRGEVREVPVVDDASVTLVANLDPLSGAGHIGFKVSRC
jgi:hypothetical protein